MIPDLQILLEEVMLSTKRQMLLLGTSVRMKRQKLKKTKTLPLWEVKR